MKSIYKLTCTLFLATSLTVSQPAGAFPVVDYMKKIERILNQIQDLQSQIEILQYYEGMKEAYEEVGGAYIDNTNNLYANKIAREGRMQSKLSELNELKESLPISDCDALYNSYLQARSHCSIDEQIDSIAKSESSALNYINDQSSMSPSQAINKRISRTKESTSKLAEFNNNNLLSDSQEGPFKRSIPINTTEGLESFNETILSYKETDINPSLKSNDRELSTKLGNTLRRNTAINNLKLSSTKYLRNQEDYSSIEISEQLAQKAFGAQESSILNQLKTSSTTNSQTQRYIGYLLATKIHYSLEEFKANLRREVALATSIAESMNQ